ncbi:MAG: MotA/TolQ/ExbB proton channel family protein [Pyrinomonadaceae bacterium]
MEHFVFLFSIQELAETFLNEQIPDAIVYVQIALFAVWSIWLFGIWIRQSTLRSKIEKMGSISIQSTNSETELFNTVTREAGSKAIYQIIIEHIQSIRDAGRNQSEIDIPLLIRNTHDRLNTGSAFLRSVLSLFLILGLLGTLFGLAISLSQFSNSLLAGSQITNEVLQQGLRELLKKLGGAFFPSIVGVLFTIIGVFLYSFFQRGTNIPLGNLIERKTLNDWVPSLIKTPRQNETEGLEQLKGLIQENVRLAKENEDAVKGFKVVTETLKSEAGDLATNVRSAGETLRILGESSQNLKEFSEKFVESVSHLTSFQQDLKNIYEQNTADSKKFHETVETILADNKSFQDAVSEQFKLQSEETEKLFERLKIYEEGYLESRKSIDENLNQLLVTASNTYEKIGSQSDENVEALVKALVEDIGKPLQDKLTEDLGDVSNKVSERLEQIDEKTGTRLGEIGKTFAEIKETFGDFVSTVGTIKERLEAIKSPIDDAATEIKGIATNFDERTEALLKKLQSEFHEQSTITSEQLENLKGLNHNIGDLSGKFDGLGEKIDSFNGEVSSLGNNISNFNAKGRVRAAPNPVPGQPQPKTRWQRFKKWFREN